MVFMNQNTNHYQSDEFDINNLISLFLKRKILIALITSFFTLIFAIQSTTLETTYTSSAELMGASDNSKDIVKEFMNPNLNSYGNKNISLEENFYNNLLSFDLQKKTFLDGGYLDLLNIEDKGIDNIQSKILSFTSKVSVLKKDSVNNYEDFHLVSFTGKDPKITEKFLVDLIIAANNKTTQDVFELIHNRNSFIVNKLIIKREAILSSLEQRRLVDIEKIKELDNRKIKALENQINSLKNEMQIKFKNEILLLSEKAILAKSLGIIENNFRQDSKGENNIQIFNTTSLPDWYLYGEKALLKKIELLKKRSDVELYSADLLSLQSKLAELKNNPKLKALQARKDESLYSYEIVDIDKKLNEINLLKLNLSDVTSIQQRTFKNSISHPNKVRYSGLGFIVGLMISFLLILVIDALIPNVFSKRTLTSSSK